MKILGLVPARGGSKGIPRKNLKPFLGVSLLERTVRCGLVAKSLAAVVVSTDDEEIAAAAKAGGARVPFLRPAKLADDAAPTLGVVQHALRTLEEAGERFDAICLLQPTNPLRLAEDIDAACVAFESSGSDSVVSVAPIPVHFHPQWAYVLQSDGDLTKAIAGPLPTRRQDLPTAWYREGSIYITQRDVVMNENSLYGSRVAPYFVPPERSGNIDTPEDWAELEARARSLGWS